MKVLCITLFSLTTLCCGADLSAYKNIYAQNMEGIYVNYWSQLSKLMETYRVTLESLQEKAQQTEDHNKVMAINNEIELLSSDWSAPNSDTASQSLEINRARVAYRQHKNTILKKRAHEVLSLAMKYDNALDGMQRDFVRSGKTDDAILIQKERTLIRISDEVLMAKATLRPPSRDEDVK